jgi:hypothetical protein
MKVQRVERQNGDDDPESDQVDEYGEEDYAQLGLFIGHVADMGDAGGKLPGGIRKGNPKCENYLRSGNRLSGQWQPQPPPPHEWPVDAGALADPFCMIP